MARIFTIGHGSRQLEEFLGALLAQGVTLLVDVRTFPRSRWSKQFDKTALSKPGALPAGISYRHMPELGGYEPDGSKELRRKDERWATSIKWLSDRAKRETIALFCMEEDSDRCHRHQTIEPDLVVLGVEVVHLPRGPKKSSSRQSTLKL
jgi:uncharacterized protein (DUF488 family)